MQHVTYSLTDTVSNRDTLTPFTDHRATEVKVQVAPERSAFPRSPQCSTVAWQATIGITRAAMPERTALVRKPSLNSNRNRRASPLVRAFSGTSNAFNGLVGDEDEDRRTQATQNLESGNGLPNTMPNPAQEIRRGGQSRRVSPLHDDGIAAHLARLPNTFAHHAPKLIAAGEMLCIQASSALARVHVFLIA